MMMNEVVEPGHDGRTRGGDAYANPDYLAFGGTDVTRARGRVDALGSR